MPRYPEINQWSAQVYTSADLIPLMGKLENTLIIFNLKYDD
jgi:hypothetical protein